jgi:hypothetical protein
MRKDCILEVVKCCMYCVRGSPELRHRSDTIQPTPSSDDGETSIAR